MGHNSRTIILRSLLAQLFASLKYLHHFFTINEYLKIKHNIIQERDKKKIKPFLSIIMKSLIRKASHFTKLILYVDTRYRYLFSRLKY